MAKVRILVVEDDPLHAAKMEVYLEILNYEQIAVADNATEALQLFRDTKPDLLLLDIDLGGETDGVGIAEQVNKTSPTPIIFTTSFKDKATIDRAKTTKPYAYLTKPIEQTTLQAAIESALCKFAQDLHQEQITDGHFAGWTKDLVIKNFFFIKSGNSIEKVACMDVLWIEATEKNYLNLITEKRSYRFRSSFKELLKKLSAQHFLKAHNSYVVNIHHIDTFDINLLIINILEQKIPVEESCKAVLMERLNLLN